jgi:IS30 family transposase
MVATKPHFPREWERRFWRLIKDGWSTEAAADAVGVSWQTGRRWFRNAGGMTPLDLTEPAGRYLSFLERELIALGRAMGLSMREIARQLGRAPSTISRELKRNISTRGPMYYKATVAQSKADARARRPKLSKLVRYLALHDYVQSKLACQQHWSPQQISRRLVVDFPDDEQMRISPEAIYQALFIQGRGALRRELTGCLRTGRALRRPRARARDGAERRRSRIKDMVLISERPAEVADRAVPGHWEGDLIIGEDGLSAIGTLVERTTRFVMLLHLANDRSAPAVRDAIIAAITTLPEQLRKSLTWDQGVEMAEHAKLKIDANLAVYFCDPHSPWQRGSNENTNGLLRQYFPKGTDLSVHSPDDLADVAAALNGRPRMTLDWRTPAEALNALLSQHAQTTGVATTG